ncbi:MAG: DUF192 domain-containing protein [Acidimicrobiales bacterium]
MTNRRVRPVLWAVAALLLLGLVAFLAVGANGPPDPRLEPLAGSSTPTGAGGRQGVEGFGEIAFHLQTGSATGMAGVERCALLAETDRQLQQGLMGRRDLSGYDAMIFRFGADTTGSFFMRNVPVPLEIAWFDAAGGFVSSTEMAPCPDMDGCPTYAPAGAYRFALEVLGGGLDRLGIGEGTVLIPGQDCGAG